MSLGLGRASRGNEAYPMIHDDVLIEAITGADEADVQSLIRRNLSGYDEAGSVLASTFRRLKSLISVYTAEGARFFVLRNVRDGGKIIGGAGIGSLHGLSPREGLGEVRDLVLEKEYRGQGLGARLLKRCVEEGRALGYKRLYLETTPAMEKAQKLFLRFGFRPVTQAQADGSPEKVPCYFILEDATVKAP
jgi:putative acetyltransferase